MRGTVFVQITQMAHHYQTANWVFMQESIDAAPALPHGDPDPVVYCYQGCSSLVGLLDSTYSGHPCSVAGPTALRPIPASWP